MIADRTSSVKHSATIGNRQRVARTTGADGEIAGVGPDRAAIGDEDRIVISASVDTDIAIRTKHSATIGNRQRVARTTGADGEVAGGIPDRAGISDGDRIVSASITDDAVAAHYDAAAIGNRQGIARTRRTDSQAVGGIPDRAGTGDGGHIVAPSITDDAAADHDDATAVGDGQGVS